jgi:hypothetical protein
VEHAGANKTTGTAGWNIYGNGGHAAAAAGVGQFFRPLPTTDIVRFATFCQYSYYWEDESAMATAHNDGYINLYVVARSPNNGINWVEVDKRIHMWSDGTSWFGHDTDSRDGNVWADDLEAIIDLRFQPWLLEHDFVCWCWTEGSCDDAGLHLTPSSQAAARLGMKVPFMVFEQS